MKTETAIEVTSGTGSRGILGSRQAILILAVFAVYTVAAEVHRSARASFWFDEITAVSAIRQHTLDGIWKALRAGADSSAPLFAVVESRVIGVTADQHIGYRIVPILGLLCVCGSLFAFVRKHAGNAAGLIAGLLPLLTSLYAVYAIEARAYAAATGCLALALCAWQRAGKFWGAAALAICLAAAVSMHYYAVLGLLAFGAGEVVYWYGGQLRRWAVLALLLGAAPLAAYWPMLAVLKGTFGAGYFSKPNWTHIPSYYDLNVGLGNGLGAGLTAVVTVGLVTILINQLRRRQNAPALDAIASHVLTLTFVLLPFAGYAVAKVGHGGLTARYVLWSLLGICAGAGYLASWAGRRAITLFLAFIVFAFAFQEARYWLTLGSLPARPAEATRLPDDILHAAAIQKLPLVISNGLEYLPMAYYGRNQNLVALVDRSAAMRYTGSDSVDMSLKMLLDFLPLDVQDYASFTGGHSRFLLYSRAGDRWNWLPSRLRDDGDVLSPLVIHEDQALFMVERPTASKP